MSNLLDSIYFGLTFILTVFCIIFFISRKRQKSINKLKLLIIALMGITVIFFISNSLSFLTLSSELIRSSGKVLSSNIFSLSTLKTSKMDQKNTKIYIM